MSAYRERAEQLEPEVLCEKCGEPIAVTPVGWHICKISGEALDRVAEAFTVVRPVVGYDEVLRVPILASDDELRRLVLASLKGGL